jgi:serine/threonine protein phosphatase PrpC
MLQKDSFLQRLDNLKDGKRSIKLASSSAPQLLHVEYLADKGLRKTMEDADVSFAIDSDYDTATLSEAMVKSIKDIDQECRDNKIKKVHDGACILTLSITKDGKAVCASVGDSLAIVYVYNSVTKKVTPHSLNQMHRPSNPDEFERIKQSGGKMVLKFFFQILDRSKIPNILFVNLNNIENKTFVYSEKTQKNFESLIKQIEQLNKEFGLIAVAHFEYRLMAKGVSSISYSRSIGDSFDFVSNEPSVSVTDLKALAPNPEDKVVISMKCDGYFDWSQIMCPDNYALLVESAIEAKKESMVVDLMHNFACNAFTSHSDLVRVRSEDNLTNITAIVDFEKLNMGSKTHVFAVADGHGGDVSANLFVSRFPVIMMCLLKGNIEFLISDHLFESLLGSKPNNTIRYSLHASSALGAIILGNGNIELKGVDEIIRKLIATQDNPTQSPKPLTLV